jgi:hypothetical protein
MVQAEAELLIIRRLQAARGARSQSALRPCRGVAPSSPLKLAVLAWASMKFVPILLSNAKICGDANDSFAFFGGSGPVRAYTPVSPAAAPSAKRISDCCRRTYDSPLRSSD